MRKISVLTLVVTCSVALIGHANAEDSLVSVEKAKSKTPSAAAPEFDQKAYMKKMEIIEKKRQELNGTSWEVEVFTSDKRGQTAKPDRLTFQNNQLTVESLNKLGYVPTNYSVTVPSETSEIAVFETMQTSPDGDVCFVRGEWVKDTMQGQYTEQIDKGKISRQSRFKSASRVEVSKAATIEINNTKSQDIQEEAPKALTSKEKPTGGITVKSRK